MKNYVAVSFCMLCTIWVIDAHAKQENIQAAYRDFDQFQEELASRARKQLGISDDFKIRVTGTETPVGTLYRPGTSIEISSTKCALLTPNAHLAENMYPPYTVDKRLGINLGIDSGVIGALTSLGVKFNSAKTFTYSVADAHVRMLSDDDMKSLLDNNTCSSAIPAAGAILVRGYVSGIRTYGYGTKQNGSVSAAAKGIGNLSVTASSNRGINLQDKTASDFLQIYAEVKPAADHQTLAIESVTPVNSTGKIYIQRDAADTGGKAAEIRSSLAAASFNVAPYVESIDSAKMPETTQVRYFNAVDLPMATKVAAQLSAFAQDVKLVKLGLPAPQGQLEVWYAKENQNH